MSDSTYTRFISLENFQLAWQRVRYHDRPDSRDRIGLKTFAANREHNLEILRSSVEHKVFVPGWPEIKYDPKPSMTLRPMAFLATADRVVYQAIGNVIADNSRAKLAMLANRQFYANVLAAKEQEPFFRYWKPQYKRFQDRYLELLEEGNSWIVETDIAAFYETIDHLTLFELLIDNSFLDEATLSHLRNYLPVWGAARNHKAATRGIPQGSLVSDLLANIYLYGFDREFAAQSFYCLRYVDDIRLLARSKEAAQKGLIRVDKYLKGYGLLLQTKKTMVREAYDDVRDEVDRMAAQLSEIDDMHRSPGRYVGEDSEASLLNTAAEHLVLEDFHEEPKPQAVWALIDEGSSDTNIFVMLEKGIQKWLRELFESSLVGLDDPSNKPFAERHLKFALNRLKPTQEITDKALPLFIERPWLSDTIARYLGKGELSIQVSSTLQELVETHDVYDSMVSIAIRLLLRKQISLRHCHHLFRQWLAEEQRHWSLLETAALALGESEDNLPVLLQGLNAQSAIVRRMCLIQALRHAEDVEMAEDIIARVIDDQSIDVIIALIYLAYNEWDTNLTNVLDETLSSQDTCIRYARGYDSTLPDREADYIRHVLSAKYRVDLEGNVDFHEFLGSEYKRAAEFLWRAESSFLSNPSRYVSQLDLFHEELLFPILVDKLTLKNTREELAKVELSDRIQMLLSKKRELATLAGAMSACRELRRNPETHSRFHGELAYTNEVTWQERDNLKRRLCGGYQELAEWMANGCP